MHYNEEFYFADNQRFFFRFQNVAEAINESFTTAGTEALFVAPPGGHAWNYPPGAGSIGELNFYGCADGITDETEVYVNFINNGGEGTYEIILQVPKGIVNTNSTAVP